MEKRIFYLNRETLVIHHIFREGNQNPVWFACKGEHNYYLGVQREEDSCIYFSLTNKRNVKNIIKGVTTFPSGFLKGTKYWEFEDDSYEELSKRYLPKNLFLEE